MKNLVCNGARTRYGCKAGHSFQLLKTLIHNRCSRTKVKSNHAQLLGCCVHMTFACHALDGNDIEQVVYSQKGIFKKTLTSKNIYMLEIIDCVIYRI